MREKLQKPLWALVAILSATVLWVAANGCSGSGSTEPPVPVELTDIVTVAVAVDEVEPGTNRVMFNATWVNYDTNADVFADFLHFSLEYRDSLDIPDWYMLDSGGTTQSIVGAAGTYNPDGPWFEVRWTAWTDDRVRGDTTFTGGYDQLVWARP
jgi:hypothetical protein